MTKNAAVMLTDATNALVEEARDCMGSEDLVEGYERPRVLLKLLYLDIATSKVASEQMDQPKKLKEIACLKVTGSFWRQIHRASARKNFGDGRYAETKSDSV
jgi:hypothetical protein